jgi:hypothetical protein
VIFFRGGGAISGTTGSGAEFEVLTVEGISGVVCAVEDGAEICADAVAAAGGGAGAAVGAGTTAWAGGDSAGSGFGTAAAELEGVVFTLDGAGTETGVGVGAEACEGAGSGVMMIRCFTSSSCASLATSLA